MEFHLIDIYSLKNIFKGLFETLSHHLIESLRSQTLRCIIANLFFSPGSNIVVNSYHKTTVKTIIRVDFLLIHLGFCRNFQIFRATEVREK